MTLSIEFPDLQEGHGFCSDQAFFEYFETIGAPRVSDSTYQKRCPRLACCADRALVFQQLSDRWFENICFLVTTEPAVVHYECSTKHESAIVICVILRLFCTGGSGDGDRSEPR